MGGKPRKRAFRNVVDEMMRWMVITYTATSSEQWRYEDIEAAHKAELEARADDEILEYEIWSIEVAQRRR